MGLKSGLKEIWELRNKMAKILISGSLNNFDLKIKKFLLDFSKQSIDNPKEWEKMIFDFFSKEAFIFYVATIQRSEENLEEIGAEVVEHYFSFLKVKCRIFDTDELFKSLIIINEFLKHGGDIAEYYKFFFINNFIIRQMYTKRTDLDDSNFKNFSAVITTQDWILGEGKNKLYQRVWIIKPDNTLIYPDKKYWEEVDQILNKDVQRIINKSKKSNIRKRDPIESRLRHEVFKRDEYRCLECGKTNKDTTLHVDHILPVAQGGSDELYNLQTLCQACNLAKSNRKWKGGIKINLGVEE